MRRTLVTRSALALALALLMLLAACGRQAAPAEPSEAAPAEQELQTLAASDLFISEYIEGSGVSKAIEIYNGTGGDIDLTAGNYTLDIYFNGKSTPDTTINLTGTLASGDVYVVADDGANAAILAEADLTPSASFFNGNDAVVLSKDGTALDVIGQIGFDPGSEWGTGDTSTENNTLRRKDAVMTGDPGGSDTFDPSIEWDGFPQDTFDGLGCHLDCPEVPVLEIGTCGDPATLIHEIQGAGTTTPLMGQTVVIEGVVVGDFQENDGDPFESDLDGFFVQEEDADTDSDPATSEGIFVYARGAADVQVGDVVRVMGVADEHYGMTQVSSSELFVCDTGADLPTVTEIEFPLASVDDLETFEGMYVTFPQDLFIAEFYNFDRYGEIVLANPIDPFGRHYQPTSYQGPADAQAELDTIALNRITLDDGRTTQNPDPARHPNGSEFTLDNRFRGGDTVTNATGVIHFSFGSYKLQPTEGADYAALNPRPTAPAPVGGDVTVATLNVLNYFSTVDDGAYICGPSGDLECRGADDAEEFTRQRDKVFAALAGLDADIVGLVEIENGTDALADLVIGLNDVVGADTYAAIETGPIGSDAIRVALIYKSATVEPVGPYAVLDTPAFLDPNGLGDDKNRPAVAQTFRPVGGDEAVTVVVNHFKSKGSECGPGDDDDYQGSCNLTRTLAAQELLDWLADPTSTAETDVLLIGDYNAYDEEDPIQVLLDAGYADLLEDAEGEDTYTYVFDGKLGHLDYVFASPSLTSKVTGATAWAINADEPDILDYDTSYKQAAQDALYEPDAYRSSDHDPVLVGLDLTNQAPTCDDAKADTGRLWPANHQLVAGSIAGVTDADGDAVTITIDAIHQDEPVNARGDGDTMPDAFIGLGNDFEIRAERDGKGNGRVYHVTFTASDATASCTGTVQISVNLSQGRNGAAVDDGPLYDSTSY